MYRKKQKINKNSRINTFKNKTKLQSKFDSESKSESEPKHDPDFYSESESVLEPLQPKNK